MSATPEAERSIAGAERTTGLQVCGRNTRFAVRRLRLQRDHALAALAEVYQPRMSALQHEWDERRARIWATMNGKLSGSPISIRPHDR